MDILSLLNELRDEKYAQFQAKLTPNVDAQLFIGVRVPQARNLAKQIANTPLAADFMQTLPHKYYDENILHALLISQIKNFDQCIEALQQFLPYVDNWAVCDIMSPKIFAKNKPQLIDQLIAWTNSPEPFICRYGIGQLMGHFLDKDFSPSHLDIVAAVKGDEYYRRMMIAWYFATALAKQWQATIPVIENHRLQPWTHNKTIQKAIESNRITPEQKEYLRSLKTN